ncbi:MAG: MraY family glycosyltransferase [Pseudomonadota bacterium]
MTLGLVGIFIISLVICLGLTPLARLIGVRLGVMDMPGELSIHSSPTPRTGGLAMFVAFAVSIFLARPLFAHALDAQETVKLFAVMGGAALICGVGLLGDMGKVPSRVEYALQFLPAALVSTFGIQVRFIPVAIVAVPLTLFYLVGGACAVNLLDGMDGLAAGVTVIAALFFGLAGLMLGNQLVVVLSVALMGSALGFLYHNFCPARIFMGDVGSLFLGFVLATMAILLTSQPYDFKGLVVPVLILGVPVFDTFLAITRRLANHRRIISGDRDHLYDLLNAAGLSMRKTIVIMYGLALILGATALLTLRLTTWMTLLIVGLEGLVLLALAFRLGSFIPKASHRGRGFGEALFTSPLPARSLACQSPPTKGTDD